MSERTRRQQIIVELVTGGPIANQKQLRAELAGRGVEVTQATLSRDLRDLGAAKTLRGYRLGEWSRVRESAAGARVGSALSRVLRGYVTSAQPASSLVVLHTGPGQAQLVAVELDRASIEGAAGCLAGDDTIFLATISSARARALARELRKMAALQASSRR